MWNQGLVNTEARMSTLFLLVATSMVQAKVQRPVEDHSISLGDIIRTVLISVAAFAIAAVFLRSWKRRPHEAKKERECAD